MFRRLRPRARVRVNADGKVRAVVGSPGGPTITTTVAQIILQIVDYDRPLLDAVRDHRIHHQWKPDAIRHEPGIEPAEPAK